MAPALQHLRQIAMAYVSSEHGLSLMERRIHTYGISVLRAGLCPDDMAVFDERSITLKSGVDPRMASLDLAHTFGSIFAWAEDPQQVHQLFDNLRAVKADPTCCEALEGAVRRFRLFEERSAEYGAGLLADIGLEAWLPRYSEFFRADMDAMTLYHLTSKLPFWPRFFDAWRNQHRRRQSQVPLFHARPVGELGPAPIELQVVKRRLWRSSATRAA